MRNFNDIIEKPISDLVCITSFYIKSDEKNRMNRYHDLMRYKKFLCDLFGLEITVSMPNELIIKKLRKHKTND